MTRAGRPAVTGTLIPVQFASLGLEGLFAGRLGEDARADAQRRFRRWWRTCEHTVGPATAVRTLIEAHGRELFAILGFRWLATAVGEARGWALARAECGRSVSLPAVVSRWGDDLDRRWGDTVRAGLSAGSPWALCWNVRELRIVDASRPWGRHYVAFDLATCATDAAAFAVFWAVSRAEAFWTPSHSSRADARPSLFAEVVGRAAREQARVCGRLEGGVTASLPLLADAFLASERRAREPSPATLLSQSLTVVYRLLFLLFAEARSLVPMWHPTYRESYSIEALRDAVERIPPGTGLWPAIQAVSRLAHRGCVVGSLDVTPFNGHLFAPQQAPVAESAAVPDHVLSQIIEALTTIRVGRRHRVRIAFEDLGVEQLGAIYERVLDHRLVVVPQQRDSDTAPMRGRGSKTTARRRFHARLESTRLDRKASGTFYTPRALTHLIVRRTLGPLVEHARSEQISSLRVLDPAMGSGAFLVAACDYLARAYERAVVAEQRLRDHELDERDRAGFRRLIARTCLYGVDRNPMAVQLARLSLWLATLARDVPLTFLDHHLRVGDSLLGASLDDLLRQPPGERRRAAGTRPLPLLDATSALDDLQDALPLRLALADLPDDTVGDVRRKETLLEALRARGAPLTRWRQAADLWCASWFWPDRSRQPTGTLYRELQASVLGRARHLPGGVVEDSMSVVSRLAEERQFFHWSFEFPEILSGVGDRPPGFDAVVGNPPWDMIRDEPGSATVSGEARRLWSFVKYAGIYGGAAKAHGNVYQLFVERAMQLLRVGGRLGFVVPSGLLSDHGAGPVRRLLFDRCAVDSCLVLDNRRALFPIHRSVKFAVVCATRGTPTAGVPLQQRSGDAASLDACGEGPGLGREETVVIPRALLERLAPNTLAVPSVRTSRQLALLERLWHAAPALSSAEGWGVTFGRELNASDDRHLFTPVTSDLPVLEGKHITSFRARVTDVAWFLPEAEALRRLPSLVFSRARVAYRDVASATNERTLIVAVVPAGTVTTHTLFCCRDPLDDPRLHALSALLNSFVANWLVRRWVTTHVTVALVERLPVPAPAALGPALQELALLARELSTTTSAEGALGSETRLQILAARAWGVSPVELSLILDDFPLVSTELKRQVSEQYT